MTNYNFANQNTTLVHICCSVDSHHFLTQLLEKYPNKNFCGFFYNPNIHPNEEYQMRLSDVKRSCKMLGIPLIIGEYDLQEWTNGSKGLEDEPEKGKRCGFCFDFRLKKAAQVALKSHCVEFTTTLLASPLKSQKELFMQGEVIAREFEIPFLQIDVRGDGGTQAQNKLAKKANLYRQNYCGCLYALQSQRKKSQKIPLELLSSLNAQKDSKNLPALRQNIFAKRESLEKNGENYKQIKRKVQYYQLLKGLLERGGEAIPSFICSYSFLNKKTKAKIDFWDNGVGYANKDGILLLEFESFREFLGVSDFELLLKEGLSEKAQLDLRFSLYGDRFFTSPIVIVNQKIDEFSLEIAYQIQEEILEDFIKM